MTDEAAVRALLSRLRQNPEQHLLGELYDLTSPVVWAWASLLLSAPAASRVVVSTYLAVWREAVRYPDGRHPWCWILGHLTRELRSERSRV